MKIVWETCIEAECGYSPFPMEAGYNERCRKTLERFRCPDGHGMVYRKGQTKEQKRIKVLESDVRFLQNRITALSRDRDRAKARCRWTGCRFQAADLHGLGTHMRAAHGMPTLSQVEEVAS